MPDPVFEKYEPVLFNIEMALIGIYRRDEEMTDFEAEQATTALIRSYQAEQRKRGAPQLRLNDLGQKAYDAVRQVCEWHLGRRDDQPELEAVAPFRESGAISVRSSHLPEANPPIDSDVAQRLRQAWILRLRKPVLKLGHEGRVNHRRRRPDRAL